jgi:DNA-binding GntR family transcriptional regulator
VSPEVQRPEPAYMQIARHIRTQIQTGELNEGDHVPSAREIKKDWNVAMATATRVLAALKSEGLVQTVPGVGTTVSAAAATKQAPQERIDAVRRTGKVYPPNERAQIQSAELVPAPPHIAEALGLEEGSQVIRRHRVTFRDDQPVSASVSWFSGDLATTCPKLLSCDRILQGTFGYIEDATSKVLAGGTDQAAADAATEQDATDLGVEVGSPVLRGRNWMTTGDGEVLEYGESVSVARRWTTHKYEIG